ncbi:hypothetical protein JCM16303_005132 [Sporobolomyces ruberrimus]
MSKRRRLATPANPTRSYNTTSDLVQLLAHSSNQRSSAFSPTANLIALAAPLPRSPLSDPLFPSTSPEDPLLPLPPTSEPLSLHLTYLSGPSSSSIPRLNFRLQLPLLSHSSSSTTTSGSNKIKLVSFSPDGAYLLCVSGSNDAELDGMDDWLTVFEQSETGCIDQWNMVLHEQAARFGARGNTTGGPQGSGTTDGKEVVSVRWVGEPRAWYPNPEHNTGEEAQSGRRPFSCAPPRSSSMSGAAFVAVLCSDEIVFVHLPRTSPLLPNIVCMPLHPPPSALSSPPSTTTSLPEITALSPSRRALTLTAVPTPPTPHLDPSLPKITGGNLLANPSSSTLNNSLPAPPPNGPAAVDQSTPSANISQLVGSLVSTLPSIDSSLPLPLAPSPIAGSGNAALKEELRAAELANSISGESAGGFGSKGRRRRRVWEADIGSVRGTRGTSEEGVTIFLVATATRRSRSKPRQETSSSSSIPLAPSNAGTTVDNSANAVLENAGKMEDLGLNMNLDEENFDLAALDGFDFGSLDAAFGSSSSAPPPSSVKLPTNIGPGSPEKKINEQGGEDGVKEWDEWEKENLESGSFEEENNKDQWRIELSEVKIDMLNLDGPRLTVKPQSPFFASPPTFSQHDEEETIARDGQITHLAFLEDNQLPNPESSPNPGSESAVDLRLVVVSTSSTPRPLSSLSSYDFSNEPYALSEAFSHLECRKSDIHNVDLGEWSSRAVEEACLPGSGVITALAPRPLGRDVGTFVAVIAAPSRSDEMSDAETKQSGWTSKVVILSSETLHPIDSQMQTALPEDDFCSSLLLSANAAVVVCIPDCASHSTPRPVIAASPFVEDNASRMALALIKQGDASDVIGIAASDLGDAQSLSNLLDNVHSLLQAQLPLNRLLHNTSIQFDLLGVAGSLFASSNAASDPTSGAKVNTAKGLVDCAAAIRAFAKVEKKQRGVEESAGSYRCETDALWPLVGHATWYAELVGRLIRDVLHSPSDPPSPLLLHFLHPLARSLHQRLLSALLGLSRTISALSETPDADMSVAEQEMMYLASQVLEDAVSGDGIGGLERWKSLLRKVADIEGLDQGLSFGSSLSTLTIPQTIHPQSTSVLSLLRQAYPTLAPSASDSLPSPPESPADSSAAEWDAVRKCQLPQPTSQSKKSQVMMKQCLRCGKKSGAVNATLNAGVWATYEENWRSRCACGGFWRTV